VSTIQRLSILGILAGGLLGLVGCGLEAPQAPEFETTFNIPLHEERYTGQDMAQGLESVEGDEATPGPLTVRISEEIAPVHLDEQVRLRIESQAYAAELDEIDFDVPDIDPLTFTLGALAPEIVIVQGTPVTVASFSFAPDPLTLGPADEFDDFERIVFDAGSLRLTLTNHLPVPIGGGEGVTVLIEDVSAGTVAEWMISGELAPEATFQGDADLTGAFLGSELRVRLSGWCPGSGGESVVLSESQGVAIGIAFQDPSIRELSGELPALNLETTASLEIGSDVSVTEAIVSSGSLHWTLSSELPIEATVWLEASQIQLGCAPLARSVTLPAHGSAELTLDLQGAAMNRGDADAWTWSVRVTSNATDEAADLAWGQAVEAMLDASEVRFTSVRGVLDHVEIEIDPVETAVEFPDGTESVSFVAAEAEITVNNYAAVAAEASLELWGEAGGETVTVPFTLSMEAGGAEDPARASAILTEANSDLLDLLTLRPEVLLISGSVMVGDGATESVIAAGDFLDGAVTVQAPMKLVLETAQEQGDPFEVELDDDIREQFSDNLLEVVVEAEVENHFPAGVEVALHFARSEGALFANDDLILDADAVTSAAFDSGSGRVTAATTSQVILRVSEGDLDLFSEERLFGGLAVTLRSDGESAIEIWSTDYVNVKGMVSFRYRVK